MKLWLIDGFFTRRSIARQLVVLRNLLIGGFLMLGLIYAVTVGVQMWSDSFNEQIAGYRDNALQAQTHALKAQQFEANFMLTSQLAWAEAHDASSREVFEALTRARAFAPDEESRHLVQQVEQTFRTYTDTFADVVRTQTVLGLDDTQGLQLTLAEAVARLETVVNDARNDALRASMFLMRRHEKDFIQSLDEQFLFYMSSETARFKALLAASELSPAQIDTIGVQVAGYEHTFGEFFEGLMQAQVEVEAARAQVRAIEPLLEQLQAEAAQRLESANDLVGLLSAVIIVGYAVGLFAVGMALIGGLLVVSRSISEPLSTIVETINRLAGGDDSARARLATDNEFGQLGAAFDEMMDERVATQNAIRRENDQLNESVLQLLQGVAQLANKDLTIKVPVTEDVTGPVADALNLLTTETGKVLAEVTDISADVTSASMKVKEQADTAQEAAIVNRREAEQTAESIAATAQALNHIAQLAQACNGSAENAIRTTREALEAVSDTVGGINNTRDTIRETEKRIKRLGERSQEISGAVSLINTIAERTHILALNASMHAASAGEAGRGFAVVADEVQRLAENARQATAQIASLVNNIQVETMDTVSTMNAAITQVVEGAKLAEQAGERMQNSEARTADLVAMVQRIASDSTEQAKVSSDLMQRAAGIRSSSEATSQNIQQATQYSNSLVEYARSLLAAVRVFKLPA